MLLLTIALILFPLAFLDKAFADKTKKYIVFAFCFLFTVLGGVRWNTGTDWDAYYYGFLSADSLDYVLYSPYAFEKGFGLLNFIILNYFNSYTVFLLVFTFITVFLKYKVITHKIFLNYALFSLFAYYCVFIGDIVATRQSMAISITLFSTLFIIRKKLVWFILAVILASSIHRSAIVFIVAYPLFHYDFRQKTLILIYFIGLTLGLIFQQVGVSSFNIPFISSFESLSTYSDKVSGYSETGQVGYGKVSVGLLMILGYIKSLLIMIPVLYLHKNQKNTYTRLLNLLVFGSLVYFTLGAISSEFKRLNAYFSVYEMLVIPYFIYCLKNKNTRYLLILFFCLILFNRVYSAVYNFWDLYHPFLTIFDSNNYRINF